MTPQQATVLNSRISIGYEVIGKSSSMTNDVGVVVIKKGKHTMAINSLGYDDHYFGKTWNLTCSDCSIESLHQPCEACPNGYAQLKGKYE